MLRLIFGGILGAVVAYFFDPEHGKRRRNEMRDRFGATARDQAGQVQQLTEYASAKAQGVAQKATEGAKRGAKQYDDATLSEKVKTQLYADPQIKSRVSINVQAGIVQLRGEVDKPADIQKIEQQAKSVEGVNQVENLLHLPQTPAPKS